MRYIVVVLCAVLGMACGNSETETDSDIGSGEWGPDQDPEDAPSTPLPDGPDEDPAQPPTCPLSALTHSCPALPCLGVFDCAAPDGLIRCKCELPVGTPHYIAECIGP